MELATGTLQTLLNHEVGLGKRAGAGVQKVHMR
jgi:hypothetical protein